ncbi:DNA repair protein Rad50 [Flavobacterium arcticum]|uniref:DNA repair protein Rad50 n=1 Tax=Flavobacterium arcticum TaxID=1784713 RepID=A0A345H8Q6_9FLAO|nr:DNA repair protein Rad50 [Flavobacterium arcticum]AXG72966.1 DNA repair protein Rad50 [Flavobacterium arcticum]KAF2510370.1 DNA repair protein Rad50 [Flavobacterium arcticum]
MKRYPRIKRLSTLGIVHHQSFDYDFNPFRTDFVGEGGSGKSMIADILQLIFVGSAAFHSPTDSSEPRKPKTMVLRTDGKGTDMGYAFINVEINKDAFVIIGIYLESTGSSRSFIIQQGENFEPEDELLPFNKALSFSDFLKDDNILPIEDLKNHIFDTKGCVCESWTRLDKFHKLLFENYIIPVDLSINQESLKSYAKIIQAFSRESLDIKKSDKIQEFLFGNDKEKELKLDFDKAVEELSGDIRQFESNRNEIDRLTHKQTELQELLSLKKDRDEAQSDFVNTKFHYLNQQIEKSTLKMTKRLNSFFINRNILTGLKNFAETKVEELKLNIPALDEEFEEAYAARMLWQGKSNDLKKYFSWMQHFEKTGKELSEHYYNYHKNKQDIERIEEFEVLLKDSGIYNFFGKNDKLNRGSLLNIAETVNTIEKSLEEKKKLKVLNNLDDTSSLAHWALNLKRVLSPKEESVVHKYQNDNITTKEPINGIKSRYIPDPQLLIENLQVTKDEDDGFWLDLGGVREYIPYVQEPIFDTGNSDKIKEYFSNQKETLDNDIKDLEKEFKNWKILKELLNNLENPSAYLLSWELKGVNSKFDKHELYKETADAIKRYLKLLDEDEKIDEGFKKANKTYKKIDKKRSDNSSIINGLKTNLKTISIPEIDDEVKQLITKYNYQLKDADGFESLKTTLNQQENFYNAFVATLHKESKNEIAIEDLKSEDKSIDVFKTDLQKLIDEHPKISSEINTDESEITVEVLDAKDELNVKCQRQYDHKYVLVIKEFLKEKANRYIETDDFKQICSEILPPEIFSEKDLEDDEIIPRIKKLLDDINIKNKKLNIRKLQKLTSIVDKVNTEVSEQIYYSRKIRDFIDADDKTITGGHRAKLSINFENSYPRGWMEDFIDKIREDIRVSSENNLFNDLQGVSNELEKYTSLEEKMQEAFYRCGGSRNLKPKVLELLNPKSYYGLNFTIQSFHGKTNPGSTSQTYAAIALLCIARLSLINRGAKDKVRNGIRFMPIDEAAGLGSNFDMLYDIAKENDYQIISLSIQPYKVDMLNQYIYLLHNNLEESNKVNYEPVPIFGDFENNSN